METRRRPVLVLLVAMVVALVVAACEPGTPPAKSPTRPSPLPTQCNPTTVATCGLPFPNDKWTVADPSTATGRRVEVPDNLVSPAVMAEFEGTTSASRIFDGADGFSAAGPILFELDHPVAAAALPRDGGDAVMVYDTQTGERVPLDIVVNREAGYRGAAGTVLTVWPRSTFPWGHHLVAAVTDRLAAANGVGYRPSPGLQSILASGTDPNVAFLAARGVPADNIVALTDFTVRSEHNATNLLDSLTRTTESQAHPIRNLQVLPNLLGTPGVSSVVTGQVQITDFRDADTGTFTDDPDSTGRPSWVDFLLTVPASAPATGAPVAIYGHGLGIFKESMLLMAGTNAQHGVATIAIDQPNHGSRIGPDGGFIFDILRPNEFQRLVSIIPESSVDLASLYAAVKTSLSTLDTAPFNLLSPQAADGHPDLDVSRVLYEGTSLGGVLGAAFVSEHPQLDGALLQITGVGIMHNLSEGLFWYWGMNATQTGMRALLPKSATAGEAALLLNAAQHELDRGDPIDLVDRLAHTSMPIFVPYSIDDGAVTNPTTNALGELAHLPLITPAIRPVPQLATVPDLPSDGRAMFQVNTADIAWMQGTPLEGLRGLLAHVEGISSPAAMGLQNRWLDQTLAASAP